MPKERAAPKLGAKYHKHQRDPNKLANRVKLIVVGLIIAAGLGAYRDQFKSLMETNSLLPASLLLIALAIYLVYWLFLRGKRQ